MYELAYCDDAVSVIGHIVYTLGPLRSPRHHSHCLGNFIQYIFQMYHKTDQHIGGVMTIDPNQRHLCLFPEQLTDAQDWRTIGDLLPSYYSKVHQPIKSKELGKTTSLPFE